MESSWRAGAFGFDAVVPQIRARLRRGIRALGVAGVLVWVAFNGPEQSTAMKPALLALAVFFAALTGWGIATAAGVFRRRGWARGSMIIFAVLLAGMGGSAVLGIAFIR